jgi:RHS repeat-associated protein
VRVCAVPAVSATPSTVSYIYDLAGHQTAVSDTSAAIASAVPPGGSTVAYITAYAYDRLNRPTTVSFDPAPAATSPAAGPVVTFGHSYNKANQRTAETTSDNTWIGYPAAAPSTTAYSANSLNQYTAVGAITPTYDGNGNLTFDGAYTLGHDAENRLVSATDGSTAATYAFDGRGRLKLKAVGETSVTVSVTDADNREVLEYDGLTGTLLRWYAYGLGLNAVVSQINIGADTRNTPIPNLLGSIVASYDSTGALTKFGYQPYGSGTAAPQFAYTGQRIDPETGLYYYRARHYSTAFGRFLQTDPIGNDAEANRYAYVENDPLNRLDPLGLNAEGPGGSFGQNLLQGSVNTLVPGAYYSGLAQQEFQAGNYGSAAVYGAASLADATLGILTLGISTRANAALRTSAGAITKIEVGTYNTLTARSVGDALDIHHVGQKAIMSEFVPGYNAATAPAIAVPTVGHTIRGRLASSRVVPKG